MDNSVGVLILNEATKKKEESEKQNDGGKENVWNEFELENEF